MGIEAALTKYLEDDSEVAALVSARIYPGKLPQGSSPPALLYQRISTVPLGDHLNGASTLQKAKFQFSCLAERYATVISLGEALRDRINGYAGSMEGVGVASILLDQQRDDYDFDSKDFRLLLDFFITYRES